MLDSVTPGPTRRPVSIKTSEPVPHRDGRHREAADPRLTYPKMRQPAKTTHFTHFHMGSQARGLDLRVILANSRD
jgi:hypothetical protein